MEQGLGLKVPNLQAQGLCLKVHNLPPTTADEAEVWGPRRRHVTVEARTKEYVRTQRASGLRQGGPPSPPPPQLKGYELTPAEIKLAKAQVAHLRRLQTLQTAETAAAMEVAMTSLTLAARGDLFYMTDYTPALAANQSKWPIAGSVSRMSHVWKAIYRTDVQLWTELEYGFRWEWIDEDERWEVYQRNPNFDFTQHRPRAMPPIQREKFMEFALGGLLTGYIVAKKGTFTNNLFGIDEGRKYRWVISFVKLNIFQKKIKIRMLTQKQLGKALPRGAWMVVGDYAKFFWEFAMNWQDALLQGFSLSEADVGWYLNHGPREFVARMQALVPGEFPRHFIQPVCVMGGRQPQQKCVRYPRRLRETARGLGIECDGYSDEWITWAPTQVIAYLNGCFITVMDHAMGLQYTFDKHNWLPTQRIVFTGYELHTPELRRRPKWSRIVGAQAMAAVFIDHHNTQTHIVVRVMTSLIGVVVGIREGCRTAGLMVRVCIVEMTKWLRHHTVNGTTNYDAKVPVAACWVTLCVWIIEWADFELWAYMRLEVPSLTLTSGASEYGWAAHTFPITWRIKGHFTEEERANHHNVQEGMAGNKGTVAYSEQTGLRGKMDLKLEVVIPICVKREQDNKTVIKAHASMMSRSIRICETTIEHSNYCDMRALQEDMGFIAGTVMDTERIADTGSRKTSKWPQWMLATRIVRQVHQEAASIVAGFATARAGLAIADGIDLFCEPASRQFPRMVTHEWAPNSLWTDARSRTWSATTNMLLCERGWLWAFPPPILLDVIATRLTEVGAAPQPLILIVPWQPTQGWWLRLQPLVQADPIPVDQLRNLRPPEGFKGMDHSQKPPNLSLCALLINAR